MTNSNTDRNTLRKQILDNGFIPLPLVGKACYIPGWSHVDVTAEWLDEYRRNGRYLNTGIRCGNVVGVDIDCDDADLAELVDECIEAALGPTAWCRWGRESRRLLLYWTDTPIAKLRTGRYGGQQVELLGKGCQFCAYGLHPTTGLPYTWADDTETAKQPALDSVDELPAVSVAQLRDLVGRLDVLLAATGRPLESGAPGADGGAGSHDYCLTDEMLFDCLDMGMKTVAALREELPATGSWVCHLTALRADSDSAAGRAHRAHDGSVCVTDFTTGVTYFEVADAAPDGGELAALGAAIDRLAGGSLFANPVVDALGELLANYCYVAADDTVRRLDAPAYGLKRANFSQMHRSYVVTGPKSKQLLVSYWLENGAITCARAVLLPNEVARIVNRRGEKLLNLYVAPVFPAEGGSTGLFHDFVRGLIPDAGEQVLLLDWLAWKVQRPGLRMHALVLVAKLQGTGRGSLMKIMERLIGAAYTTHTTLAHVFGRTYQAQYNDWLADALLATVPEAQDAQTAGHDWASRRRAYESIKELVETDGGAQLIRRKGIANTSEDIYCSLAISTNHVDALAIESGDRRLLVLSGGAVRSAEFYRKLHAWMGVRENLGALARELMERVCAYDPFGPPPMTRGKAAMLAASQSDLDVALAWFLEEAPGDVCTSAQWLAYLRYTRTARGLEFPENYQSIADKVLAQSAVRVHVDKSKWQLSVGGAPVRPWVLRNAEVWEGSADNAALAAEILKCGDPLQKVAKLDGPPWK